MKHQAKVWYEPKKYEDHHKWIYGILWDIQYIYIYICNYIYIFTLVYQNYIMGLLYYVPFFWHPREAHEKRDTVAVDLVVSQLADAGENLVNISLW